MGRLIYAGNISLDGYFNDAEGNIDFSEPSEEVHQFWNDLDRGIRTHIYGRRLYETMAVWQTMPPTSPVTDDYAAVWRNSDKLVISSSLPEVSTPRTTLERGLSPERIAELTAQGDVTIGGPTLGTQFIDYIDDLHILLYPLIVGGGTPFFPSASAKFALADSRVFGNGVVHLHYRKDS